MLAPVCQAHKRAYHGHATGAAAVTVFRPTVAAPGRLVRLGVVLDPRNQPARLREIARMCDGAGIESLWARDDLGPPGASPLDLWTAIALAATEARHPAVGAVVSIRLRSAEALAAMVATLDVGGRGRVEVTLADRLGEGAADLGRYATRIRELLDRGVVGVADRPEGDGGIARLSIESVDDVEMDVAARVADDVLVRGIGDPGALTERVRRACERNGRDPSTMGIALEVPVSIGRTTAEAQARAEVESLFEAVGRPAEVGVFGTLEQCQERVIELAHAGVTDLRCILPNSEDVHDVIAQLTAMAVGSVDVLTPNAPRSKAPDPPETWGGRAVPR